MQNKQKARNTLGDLNGDVQVFIFDRDIMERHRVQALSEILCIDGSARDGAYDFLRSNIEFTFHRAAGVIHSVTAILDKTILPL